MNRGQVNSMNRKRKALVVPGVPGVPGPGKDPMGDFVQSGDLETASPRARAHVYPSFFPGTPGTDKNSEDNQSSNQSLNLSPVAGNQPGTHRGQPGTAANGAAGSLAGHRIQLDPHPAAPVAVEYAEALALPLVVWADLPLPSSVRVRLASGRVLWVSASRARSLEARAAVEAFFGPSEYLALAAGLVARRCGPREVEAWAARKGRELGWTLSATEAVAGAVGLLVPSERERVLATMGPGGRALTVGALVALMGGTVEAVLVEGVVAPTTAANGAARALEAM